MTLKECMADAREYAIKYQMTTFIYQGEYEPTRFSFRFAEMPAYEHAVLVAVVNSIGDHAWMMDSDIGAKNDWFEKREEAFDR